MSGAPNSIQGPLLGPAAPPPRMTAGPVLPPRPQMPPAPMVGATGPGTVNPGTPPGMMSAAGAGGQPGARLLQR